MGFENEVQLEVSGLRFLFLAVSDQLNHRVQQSVLVGGIAGVVGVQYGLDPCGLGSWVVSTGLLQTALGILLADLQIRQLCHDSSHALPVGGQIVLPHFQQLMEPGLLPGHGGDLFCDLRQSIVFVCRHEIT